MYPYTDVDELISEGNITAFLKTVESNADLSKNNFTSTLLMDTKYFDGPVTVSCETHEKQQFVTVDLISLYGDLHAFGGLSATMDKQDGSLTAYLRWDYAGKRSEILHFQTVIYADNEVVHNKTLEQNTNDTSCIVPSGKTTYSASVEAIGRCGGRRMNSQNTTVTESSKEDSCLTTSITTVVISVITITTIILVAIIILILLLCKICYRKAPDIINEAKI
jgi:hypothetical protein